MEGVGKSGVCTGGGGEKSLGDPSARREWLTALKSLACGGQGKGLPPPSLNSFSCHTDPLFVWCGGQRERGEQRLPLGPMEKDKGLAKGMSFSHL